MEEKDTIVESTVEDTEVGVPKLNPEKLAQWEQVKLLLTAAQGELMSYFAKLEGDVTTILGTRYVIEYVEVNRRNRTPRNHYSWDTDTKFNTENPEVSYTFQDSIGDVELTIKEIKQEEGGK